MIRPAVSKTVFAFVAALTLICAPKPASARHNGGSKGGGGSHGGSSHGGGGSHGGGHSSFKGGGHSYAYGGSHGNSRVSSAHMNGGHKNGAQMSRGSYAKSGGSSSRPSGNFTRNSTLVGANFGSPAASHNFDRFGASRPEVQSSRGSMGRWQAFGNSSGRSMLASARTSGNAMGGAWRSFGNMSGDGGVELSRGHGSNVRADGNWRSFGNSGNASSGRNRSGFSSFGMGRVTASNMHTPSSEFRTNRLSTNLPTSSRLSSFSSFSSSRSMENFGGSRFGVSGFGGSEFGNSSSGQPGFSNSFIGSGVSLIPNLLGGFFNLGTSGFGGQGILAANALSLAVRLFVSALGATGFGQGDSAGGDAGYGTNGFSGNFGVEAAPVWPACGPVLPLWAPSPTPSLYRGPYPNEPFGWTSLGYVGGPRIGFHYR
jgi:hypothetical protein